MAFLSLTNTLAANEDMSGTITWYGVCVCHICDNCLPPSSGRWSMPLEGSPAVEQPVMRAKIQGKEKHLSNLSSGCYEKTIFYGEPKDKIIKIIILGDLLCSS